VIVISAQNTIMTAIQATEADAYDYLPKPFDLPDLMKRAARALDQKRRATPAPKPTPNSPSPPSRRTCRWWGARRRCRRSTGWWRG
jgi:two-component system nitrogen regulation response regulator GlnG